VLLILRAHLYVPSAVGASSQLSSLDQHTERTVAWRQVGQLRAVQTSDSVRNSTDGRAVYGGRGIRVGGLDL
jgi:hypothetical protein